MKLYFTMFYSLDFRALNVFLFKSFSCHTNDIFCSFFCFFLFEFFCCLINYLFHFFFFSFYLINTLINDDSNKSTITFKCNGNNVAEKIVFVTTVLRHKYKKTNINIETTHEKTKLLLTFSFFINQRNFF